MMNVHALKTWPYFFQNCVDGKKKFELRKNDRNFKEGEFLLLQEWMPTTKKYTGRELLCFISFLFEDKVGDMGLEEGYCIMSINKVNYSSDPLRDVRNRKYHYNLLTK